MRRRHGRINTIVGIYYVVFALSLITVAIVRPFPNWDSICYAASAKSFQIHDTRLLHKEIYNGLAASVPEATYTWLTTGAYRDTVRADADAFAQQLPFYKIRLLYNLLVFVVGWLGVNIFMATHVVSAVSAAAGTWILLLTFRDRIRSGLLFLIPIGSVPLGLLTAARYGTPDGLAFFVGAVVVFLLMRGQRLLLAVLPLCILLRSDLLIFAVLVVVYLWFFEKRWKVGSVSSLVACILAYFLLIRVFDNYGLRVTYYMTFVETLPFPADTPITFGLRDYLSALAEGLGEAITNGAFLLFAGFVVASIILLRRRQGEVDWGQVVPMRILFMMVGSLAYVVAHFVIFPEIEERFFVGPYLLFFIGVLWLLAPERKTS